MWQTMAVRLGFWRWAWIVLQWTLFIAAIGALVAYYIQGAQTRRQAEEMYQGCEPSRADGGNVQCEGGEAR